MRTRGVRPCSHVRVFGQNPGIAPGSGFKPPHYRLQRNEDNRGLRPQDFFVPFFRKKYRSQSSTGGSFAAFWSAKSGAKTDPPTKKAKRRGLTLAPGARLKGGFKGRWTAERVISDTTLSLLKPASYAGARAFSPHLFERLFCQAGVVRRETRREKSAFSLAAEKEQPTARVPGAGGCIVLFLLRPLNAGRRLFPRKATCGWFWRYLLPPKGSYTPRHSPRFCLFDRRLTAVSARGR